MRALGQDLRFAVRQLWRARAFTLTAILTLALGTGANTAVFGIINGYLRPLPVPNADRLVVLAAELPGDETGFRYRFSYPALVDYRTQATVFSDVVAFDMRIGGLSIDGKTSQFVYHVVTGNFFSALGVTPAYGRVFRPDEGEQPGDEAVVMLGHAYWLKRFGGDRHVVGSIVRIDGQPTRIVGIAPAGFHGLFEGADMDGYAPLNSSHSRLVLSGQLFTDRSVRFLTIVGRLKPGRSVSDAQTAVDVVARRLGAAYPATEKNTTVRVMPEPMARPVPLRFLMNVFPLIKLLLFVLATLVLLLACLNVANLLLVRATVRQREMAVRAALGSGRGRLIRLMLTESLLLSACGAAAGLVLSTWAIDLFVGSIDLGISVPLSLDLHFDWRVFLYALMTALGAGVLVGIIPALRASRATVTGLLHDGGRGDSAGAGRQRLRSLLVVAQVAGSFVLLIVAGLFVRSLQRAEYIDLGFDPDHVLTARLNPRQIGYDVPRTTTFYDDLDRRVRALPGVESVSMAFTTPMSYIFGSCVIDAEGHIAPADEPRSGFGYNTISAEYFTTLRLPIVRGRAFTDQDIATSTRVVIVNETLAARLWPNQDPIGKRLNVECADPGPLWQVVGVAHDSKYLAVFEDALPYFYLPLTQNASYMRVLQVRSALPPEALGTSIQHEIAALDPDMPIADLATMRRGLEGGMGFLLFKIGARQASAMGLIGLILAIIGIYGVVSYGAAQRVREIGIRMALGALPRDVLRMVLQQGASLVIAGILTGLVMAAGMTLLLTRYLLLVSAIDPLTFGVVTLALAAIALAACYLPARRAMRVEPVVALRHE